MEQDRTDPRKADEHTPDDGSVRGTDTAVTEKPAGRGFMRNLKGRSGAVTLGLAASSLAMLAGRTATRDKPAAAAAADPIAPQAENADA